jgi:hypothetical protein
VRNYVVRFEDLTLRCASGTLYARDNFISDRGSDLAVKLGTYNDEHMYVLVMLTV